ncbi:hypothetical protein CPB85DRAFT_1301370 [Mucidula mucida]|nr:hypothetical protein CPB85DRAFT_1301370 [Mucidula mucida]
MSSSSSYTPVNVSGESYTEQKCYTATQRRLVTWACISTLFSIGAIFYDHLKSSNTRALSIRTPLRRPSAYINLDPVALGENRPPLAPFYYFPDVIVQYRTSDPSRILFEDSRWYPSNVGAIVSHH